MIDVVLHDNVLLCGDRLRTVALLKIDDDLYHSISACNWIRSPTDMQYVGARWESLGVCCVKTIVTCGGVKCTPGAKTVLEVTNIDCLSRTAHELAAVGHWAA